MNRFLLRDADLRRHDRVEAASGNFTHYTRSTGEQVRCEVLDLSLTGVSLKTEQKPPVGEHLLVGHRAGRVARHHGTGIGIEFLGVTSNPENTAAAAPSPAFMPPQAGIPMAPMAAPPRAALAAAGRF